MSVTSELLSKYEIHARPGQKVLCPECGKKTFSTTLPDTFGKCWHPSCNFKLTSGKSYSNSNGPAATVQSLQTNNDHLESAIEDGDQRTPATEPVTGCTLEHYAEMKKLPIDFLRSLQLKDKNHGKLRRVVIPYLDLNGNPLTERYRLALRKSGTSDDRFSWKSGSHLALYGLWRLRGYDDISYIVLVEGESDCHTLWHHDIPALGIPGAKTWKKEWDTLLESYSVVYVIAEPDSGGRALVERMRTTAFMERIKIIDLDTFGDPSELHCADPSMFQQKWNKAVEKSIVLAEVLSEMDQARAAELWKECGELASVPDLLSSFVSDLRALGYVGDTRTAKIIFLAVVSRVFDRPVSVVVKGQSSAGKSFTVESTLKFFPESAFYLLTSMSGKGLAYLEEPLAHRILIVFESAGASNEDASYLLRTLLSEGQVRHLTVMKSNTGMHPKTLQITGPTGYITTTTSASLHAENETRVLSVPIDDTKEQTRAIVESVFIGQTSVSVDPSWHALHEWLAMIPPAVTIPFAADLAQRLSDWAVRMRRDAKTLKTLIQAHALLHKASRPTLPDGSVEATLADYRAVYFLVQDIMSEGAGQAVSPTIRETVGAVKMLLSDDCSEVNAKAVAEVLGLDKSSNSRRIKRALADGYLVNSEEKKGKPMRLVIGDSLPEDHAALPHPDELLGCAVAGNQPQVLPDIPPPEQTWPTEVNVNELNERLSINRDEWKSLFDQADGSESSDESASSS